jgi:ferredoxin
MKKFFLIMILLCLVILWPGNIFARDLERIPATFTPAVKSIEIHNLPAYEDQTVSGVIPGLTPVESDNTNQDSNSNPDNTNNQPVSSRSGPTEPSNTGESHPGNNPASTQPASGESQPSKTKSAANGGKETPANSPSPTEEPALGTTLPAQSDQDEKAAQTDLLTTIEAFLARLISWWNATPLNLQLWWAFSLAGLILYLFKLGYIRKPFLFFSIVILGFYLGARPNPMGELFNLPLGKGISIEVLIVTLGFPVLISLLWGRVFCGWVCPFGAVQEFIHPENDGWEPPLALDRFLKYLKYPVLLVLGVWSWRIADNLWNGYEPFQALFNFKGSLVVMITLVIILLLSFLIKRAFCRYLCPLGAILSLTSRIAPFKMRADPDDCMVCGKCTNGVCPMGAIDSYNRITNAPLIDNQECVKCLQCQINCRRSAFRVTMHRLERIPASEENNQTGTSV